MMRSGSPAPGNGVYTSPDRGRRGCAWSLVDVHQRTRAFAGLCLRSHGLRHDLLLGLWRCGYLPHDRWRPQLAICALGNYSGALAISPQYATDHTLYVLGSGVSRSSNGGDSWAPVGTWPPFATPYQEIALPPNYQPIVRSLSPGLASGVCRPVKRSGSRQHQESCPPPTSTRSRLHPTTPQVTRCWRPAMTILMSTCVRRFSARRTAA